MVETIHKITRIGTNTTRPFFVRVRVNSWIAFSGHRHGQQRQIIAAFLALIVGVGLAANMRAAPAEIKGFNRRYATITGINLIPALKRRAKFMRRYASKILSQKFHESLRKPDETLADSIFDALFDVCP